MKDASGIRLVRRAPTASEYRTLRHEVGWEEVDGRAAARGLDGALYSVCLEEEDGTVVGCARVVGDGGIYFYIQDVIVREAYRGLGLGDRLMNDVLGFIEKNAGDNSFVGLMAAEGSPGFYRRYDFRRRPEGRPGMYRMWRTLVDS